jgi:hypothetical protein
MTPSAAFCEALDREPGVVMLLDGEGTVVFVNQAWSEVATKEAVLDSCPPTEKVLGRRFLDFVAGTLNAHLAAAFERAKQAGAFRSVWVYSECNTPSLYRTLATRISALFSAGEKSPTGYLVHNQAVPVGTLRSRYELFQKPADVWRDVHGIILQCSCCRRVKHPETAEWQMNPELVKQSDPLTSHGLCELCMDVFYGEPFAIS